MISLGTILARCLLGFRLEILLWPDWLGVGWLFCLGFIVLEIGGSEVVYVSVMPTKERPVRALR